MREKLNRFVSNLNGQFVEVSYKAAPYQCFDLAYAWVFALDIPKATVQHGSAFEIWTLASDLTREYFDLIENKIETIPQEGDIVVWSNKYGTYGHVAIVIEATQTRMKVFEQNNPLGTNAHIQDRAYTNVLGFLRPKHVLTDGVPQWLKTLLQERGLTIENESAIREIFDKAKTAEDKVSDLTDSLSSCNTDLAKKAEEVAGLRVELETQERDNKDLASQLLEARSERDKKAWEVDQLKAKNKTLVEEVAILKDKVVVLKDDQKALRSDLAASQAKNLTSLGLWEFIKLKFFTK